MQTVIHLGNWEEERKSGEICYLDALSTSTKRSQPTSPHTHEKPDKLLNIHWKCLLLALIEWWHVQPAARTNKRNTNRSDDCWVKIDFVSIKVVCYSYFIHTLDAHEFRQHDKSPRSYRDSEDSYRCVYCWKKCTERSTELGIECVVAYVERAHTNRTDLYFSNQFSLGKWDDVAKAPQWGYDDLNCTAMRKL